jgi:RNA polymerase sigma-70 factor (ECF subfamily)
MTRQHSKALRQLQNLFLEFADPRPGHGLLAAVNNFKRLWELLPGGRHYSCEQKAGPAHLTSGEATIFMVSDEDLMLDFQRGSHDAFEQLFERYREPLYGFFRRRLDNSVRADDLTQETFLAVVQATSRYEPRARVRTYLYGIALNLVAAERRKQAKGDLGPESQREPGSTTSPDPSIWVREALERLAPVEREILMLREYEQLSYSEIANTLRLPVNTVRSRLFRSRMALKQYLEPATQANNAQK